MTKKEKLLLKKDMLLSQINTKNQQLEKINKDLQEIEQFEIKNLLSEYNVNIEDLKELIKKNNSGLLGENTKNEK